MCEGNSDVNAAACQRVMTQGLGYFRPAPTVLALYCAVNGAFAAILPVCFPQYPAQVMAHGGDSRDIVKLSVIPPLQNLHLACQLECG